MPDDLGLALNSSCLLVSPICIFDQLIQKGTHNFLSFIPILSLSC